MIHNSKTRSLINVAFFIAACALFGSIGGTKVDVLTQRQAKTANDHKEAVTSRSLYSDYKGVRIGMNIEEARTKLGEPTQKADDQDLYVISEIETAQIYYDVLHKGVAISVDYLAGGSGAPPYKDVIGEKVETKADGSIYKLVRYEKAGFWVSYNRSATNSMVSITIQKIN